MTKKIYEKMEPFLQAFFTIDNAVCAMQDKSDEVNKALVAAAFDILSNKNSYNDPASIKDETITRTVSAIRELYEVMCATSHGVDCADFIFYIISQMYFDIRIHTKFLNTRTSPKSVNHNAFLTFDLRDKAKVMITALEDLNRVHFEASEMLDSTVRFSDDYDFLPEVQRCYTKERVEDNEPRTPLSEWKKAIECQAI